MATITHTEAATAMPQSAWPAALRETAAKVFSIMTGEGIDFDPNSPALAGIQTTGVVGIAGAVRANFIVRCSASTACRLASQMLGIPLDDPGAEKASCDALGEICNVLAGDFKSRIGYGFACMLSVPTVIRGADYRFRSPVLFDTMDLCFSFGGQPISVTVEIAKQKQST